MSIKSKEGDVVIQKRREKNNRSPLQEAHHQLVRRETRRVLKTLPAVMNEYDELVSYGYVGLIEALKRFDPHRGVSFQAYATQRVRGAIFDGLRTLGVYGRTGYDHLRRMSQAHMLQTPAPQLEEVSHIITVKDPQEHEQTGKTQEWGRDSQERTEGSQTITQETLNSFHTLQQLAITIWMDTLCESIKSEHSDLTRLEEKEKIKHRRSLLSQAFQSISQDEQDLIIAVYDLRRIGDCANALAIREGVHRSTISRRHQSVLKKLKEWIHQWMIYHPSDLNDFNLDHMDQG